MGEKIYVLLDVDGTLIEDRSGRFYSTWEAMLDTAGCEKARTEKFLKRYLSAKEREKREILGEWMKHDLNILSRNYSAESVDRAMDRIFYTPGAVTFVRRAKERGWEVGLISAGFTPLVERIADDLGVSIVLSVPMEYREGEFSYTGIVDAEEKAQKVRELKEEGYRVVYVGDGPNDWKAMKEADLAICVGRCSTNARLVRDFYQVLDVVEKYAGSCSG